MLLYDRKFLPIFGIIFCISDFASSTQFLLNAPKAFFDFVSLASASSSQNSSPLSRIVDYRKKEAKAAELEKRKENTEQEDLLLERQAEDPSNGHNTNLNDFMNEASPSFIQKKINKIITKLRILAQLKNAFSYTPQQYPAEDPTMETSTTHSNVTITFDDPKSPRDDDNNEIDFKQVTNSASGNDTEQDKNNTTAIESDVKNDSKEVRDNSVEELKENLKKENVHHVYSIARRGKLISTEGPEKFDLEVEKPFLNRRADTVPKHGHKRPLHNLVNNHNKNGSLSIVENTIQGTQNGVEISQTAGQNTQNGVVNTHATDPEQPTRFGTVGVFFAELLATMVGLAYGAVAQFTNGGSAAPPATL